MTHPQEIYLDANATVRPLDDTIAAVRAAMQDCWGNPSSEHARGVPSRRLLARARDATSALFPGIHPEDVVLNSGGTEGSNAVLAGAASGSTVIVTEVEHSATLEPARRAADRGAALTLIPVGADGRADPDAFRRALMRASSNVVASVQWASGETGVVQPIADIAEVILSSRPDAFLHIDAAQAAGRIATPALAGISAVTFSGHKLHGPQGTGVLAYTAGSVRQCAPLVIGGGQETGRRSGTQNVAGAAGMAAAVEARVKGFESDVERMRTMRNLFESAIRNLVPDVYINGLESERVPNTTNMQFPNVDGSVLVALLDQQGVRCSQGSACSSGRPEPSHVLRAMGRSEDDAQSSVRFSFSVLNTCDEAEVAARMVANLVEGLR